MYITFHSSLSLTVFMFDRYIGILRTQNDKLTVAGYIGLLVEHCIGIAEVMLLFSAIFAC